MSSDNDAFGFSKAGKGAGALANLAKIKPSEPDSAPAPDLEAIDAAGSKAGFTPREPGSRLVPRRRKNPVGPTITINTRVPEDVAERFMNFCDANRFSYWEGLAELMNRAKV